MCEALGAAASAAGGQLERGVDATVVEAGRSPTVRYRHDGAEHATTCRLVVGAEGRDSGVRRRAGITLHTSEPRLVGAGLLVDDLSGWPSHQLTIGTEGDVVFFVLPQGGRRARLYLMYSADQRGRFTGPTASRTFLDSFRFACMPESECVVEAKPAGPCAAYPMNDTWTDPPVVEGIARCGTCGSSARSFWPARTGPPLHSSPMPRSERSVCAGCGSAPPPSGSSAVSSTPKGGNVAVACALACG